VLGTAAVALVVVLLGGGCTAQGAFPGFGTTFPQLRAAR
jgi:hypothetical protein